MKHLNYDVWLHGNMADCNLSRGDRENPFGFQATGKVKLEF